jgi:hypothetical protein
MASRQHNEYLVHSTSAYWFYSRGSSISPEFIMPEDRDALWRCVESEDAEGIEDLLQEQPYFLSRVFNAIHPHHEPIFRWSEVDFRISSSIPQGFELTHDIVNGQRHEFYIERSGFWARSADGRHQIMFMFCWRPNDEPHPQGIQIRYIGPQRFHTFDNEIGRLMQEQMQGPHSR